MDRDRDRLMPARQWKICKGRGTALCILSEWPLAKVHSALVDFFTRSQGHTHVPNATIPVNDPTLLFGTGSCRLPLPDAQNSELRNEPFKPIFLGTVDPNLDMSKRKGAANSQHNHLEGVGKGMYHHTFFEMLGNSSFGDYFKKEAIHMAWEFLTGVYGMPKDRLYIHFGGDQQLGIGPDLEAEKLWLELGLDPSHVIPFGSKENFWENGEIHFDRIGGRDASCLVNLDDPDLFEIWNLTAACAPLANKHIDTGAGLERVTSMLQNKRSNHETDAFMGLFDRLVGKDDAEGIDTAYRVFADHVRTLTFAISDGGVPTNEGRGYILRRILRRATPSPRFARRWKQILREEDSFAKTLDRGEKLFEEYIVKTKERKTTALDEADVL
ncbi:tRNA synthetases class II (A)-domain-containing protein [Chytriomyces sp. MP71]|nr:tRNA synthetases class II (A)-domain-containing protein [Chytriomyces sp. MP71]